MTLEEIKAAALEWQAENKDRSILLIGVEINEDVTKMTSAACAKGDGKALASTTVAYSIGVDEFREDFGEYWGNLCGILSLGNEKDDEPLTLNKKAS